MCMCIRIGILEDQMRTKCGWNPREDCFAFSGRFAFSRIRGFSIVPLCRRNSARAIPSPCCFLYDRPHVRMDVRCKLVGDSLCSAIIVILSELRPAIIGTLRLRLSAEELILQHGKRGERIEPYFTVSHRFWNGILFNAASLAARRIVSQKRESNGLFRWQVLKSWPSLSVTESRVISRKAPIYIFLSIPDKRENANKLSLDQTQRKKKGKKCNSNFDVAKLKPSKRSSFKG